MAIIKVIVILSLAYSSSAINESLDHYNRFTGMQEGLKCNQGFGMIPQRVEEAALRCKDTRTASFLCFITCVYRNFQYITPGRTDDLDFGMADMVTMESFDMRTLAGRRSYFRIALARYLCGKEYMETKRVFFPTTYLDAAQCERAKEFYSCSFKNLMCGENGNLGSA